VRARLLASLGALLRATWRVRRRALSLDELAVREGTDKNSARNDFAGIYDEFLSPWRERPVAVLEIGVSRGASLRMWREYFPRGRVFGIDRHPDALAHAGSRIQVFVGDQGDLAFLDEVTAVTGALDLVVDDGGHTAELQVASLLHLWPHLKPGGIYVVEDTHTSYLAEYGMSWRRPGTTMEVLKGVADDIQQRWHGREVTLEGVESVHFYLGTCLLRKRSERSAATRLRQAVGREAARATRARAR
jgi:hypothetical protein